MNLPKIEKVKHEMTPIPGFDVEMYLAHCQLGKIYSFKSGNWLLSDNPKGVGDKGYLLTNLIKPNGESVPMYEHWTIYSSAMGQTVEELRHSGANGQLLEIDHIDGNPKNNKISNLILGTSSDNKKNRSYDVPRKRLTQKNADKIRKQFKKWKKGKVEFYATMSEKYGVKKRTVQNAILFNTYNKKIRRNKK